MKRIHLGPLLLLAGCTVQLGRNPANQFEVNPDFPDDDETTQETTRPEAGKPGPGARTPETRNSKPETPSEDVSEPSSDGLERNWRVGAEGLDLPADAEPAKRYGTLYAAFRADHREAERLRQAGSSRPGAALGARRYHRRALQRARAMEPLLAEADRKPFGEFLARYEAFCEQERRLEGTLYSAESHRLASDFAARFAPDAVRLIETADVPPPR